MSLSIQNSSSTLSFKSEVWPGLKQPQDYSRVGSVIFSANLTTEISQTRLVICDGVFDAEVLRSERAAAEVGARLEVYTLEEIAFAKKFTPLRYLKLRNGIDEGSRPDCLAAEPDLGVYAMLELADSYERFFGPIDSIILESDASKLDPKGIASKLRAYGYLLEMFELAGNDVSDFKFRFDPEGTQEELIDIKKNLLALAERLPSDLHPTTLRSPVEDQFTDRFGYAEEIESIVGSDNLKAIIVYGSSVSAGLEDTFGDYDNWLIVSDLDRAYSALRTIGGKLWYQDHEVTFNLISADVADKVLQAVQKPTTRNARLVYGEANLPSVERTSLEVAGWQSVFGKMINSRTSNLSTFYEDPNILLNPGKERVFQSMTSIPLQLILKNLLYSTQSRELPPLIKTKTVRALEKLGVKLPDLPNNEDDLLEVLRDNCVMTARFFDRAISFLRHT